VHSARGRRQQHAAYVYVPFSVLAATCEIRKRPRCVVFQSHCGCPVEARCTAVPVCTWNSTYLQYSDQQHGNDCNYQKHSHNCWNHLAGRRNCARGGCTHPLKVVAVQPPICSRHSGRLLAARCSSPHAAARVSAFIRRNCGSSPTRASASSRVMPRAAGRAARRGATFFAATLNKICSSRAVRRRATPHVAVSFVLIGGSIGTGSCRERATAEVPTQLKHHRDQATRRHAALAYGLIKHMHHAFILVCVCVCLHVVVFTGTNI
jgi:hypothetical protein